MYLYSYVGTVLQIMLDISTNCDTLNDSISLETVSYNLAANQNVIIPCYIDSWMVENVCTGLYTAINVPPKNCLFLDIDKARGLIAFFTSITNSQASVYFVKRTYGYYQIGVVQSVAISKGIGR